MTLVFNQQAKKQNRKQLRNNLATPEVILWSCLKGKQLNGYKFRRQQGIGRYVTDFYCPKARLAIEIDGDSHFTNEAQAYDRHREEYFKSLGITTIRFTNKEVRENLNGVLIQIVEVTECLIS